MPIAFSRFIAMAAFLLMLLHPSPWVCIALLSAVAFGTDLGIPAFWSICQDIGGRSVAAVLGWGNMWGNLGAFVSPMLLGLISRHWDWDAVFLVCAWRSLSPASPPRSLMRQPVSETTTQMDNQFPASPNVIPELTVPKLPRRVSVAFSSSPAAVR
ncbi:MAG: hypothetical protein U0992_19180 [Planctomycetaceae bacterium]